MFFIELVATDFFDGFEAIFFDELVATDFCTAFGSAVERDWDGEEKKEAMEVCFFAVDFPPADVGGPGAMIRKIE